ncbi:hypothetical protein [uncultured Bacteroides sp.]|uniref:dual OB domain-containing protein n=1 Tax=uncultured Bacteroides sp. TaxID=162156 RepID=UPI002595C2F5|nr:hypothetical protein [uncultured Bacteroides sp.]
MATVLIVSKTKMANGVCVGGINEQNGELIRLHNERGGNLTADVPYEIGDRWEMTVETAWNVREAPHVEDKQTSPIKKLDNVGISGIVNYVRTHNLGNRLYKGHLNGTFDGCLQSKIYVTRDKVPGFSTQFWVSDESLTHVVSFEKDYYIYRGLKIKYVGFLPPVASIPAGTIVRLSLANWFDGKGAWSDERCYLQISGWYLPQSSNQNNPSPIDLPF